MNAPDNLAGLPSLRLPPHSIEAEQSVIGGLLLDGRAWDRIADRLADSDFYRDDHRRIFRHIARLVERGVAVDVLTLWEAIEAAGETNQTGGIAYLGEIANATPSAANIRHYAAIVRDKAQLRRLVAFGDSVADQAMRESSPLAVLDAAQNGLLALADSGPGADPETVGTALTGVLEAIEKRYQAGGDIDGLAGGFADVDKLVCGMQRGALVIVAGRPSMGKTAFALNTAENVAGKGQPVLVFSMEMSRDQVTERCLSSLSGIPHESIRTGRLTEADFDAMAPALQKLNSMPMLIDEATSLTTAQMAARARRVRRKHKGLGLVVIDYLQLMAGESGGNNRNEELSGITRRLKLMAKDLDCPVLVLSQLSRKVEDRATKRPLMSDLRDSGAIEQDADVILMLYRDEYYNPDSLARGAAEVLVVKNRNGKTGEAILNWQEECVRFRDMDRGEQMRIRGLGKTNSGKGKGFRE